MTFVFVYIVEFNPEVDRKNFECFFLCVFIFYVVDSDAVLNQGILYYFDFNASKDKQIATI